MTRKFLSWIGLCLIGMCLFGTLPGCENGPTNVMENADEKEIADYKAAIAEEQALMEEGEDE